ncbi:MAG: hypothetical protein LBS09_06465 [Bacteroidales bacterium]|nr:hypothetical protein [Bacteroidales bacterium]
MSSVRYYLRSKKTNPSVIMGHLYHDGEEFVCTTRYSVHPANWNYNKNRVTNKERYFEDINQ